MCMASGERQKLKLINNSSGGRAGGQAAAAEMDCWPRFEFSRYRLVNANASVLMSRRVEVTETIREWRI